MKNASNLTKRELVLAIYEKNTGAIPQKHVSDVVQKALDTIQSALAGGRSIEFRGFAALTIQRRKRRVGRNPNNPGRDVIIPARHVVKFKAGKVLKAQLAKL